jgi:hypothetical protein
VEVTELRAELVQAYSCHLTSSTYVPNLYALIPDIFIRITSCIWALKPWNIEFESLYLHGVSPRLPSSLFVQSNEVLNMASGQLLYHNYVNLITLEALGSYGEKV